MTINDKIIKNKLGLLNLAEELDNVSKACKVMGFSRDTFYRYKSAVENQGIEALLDQNRIFCTLIKNPHNTGSILVFGKL